MNPRVIEAIFDALIAHEGGALPDPRRCGAIEEFWRNVERLPRADRRALAAFVAALEWLPGPGRRLSRMPLRARRAFLRRLLRSPVRIVRALLRGLASLVFFSYYTREATWPAIGYDGPWLGRVPVEVAPVPRPGLESGA